MCVQRAKLGGGGSHVRRFAVLYPFPPPLQYTYLGLPSIEREWGHMPEDTDEARCHEFCNGDLPGVIQRLDHLQVSRAGVVARQAGRSHILVRVRMPSRSALAQSSSRRSSAFQQCTSTPSLRPSRTTSTTRSTTLRCAAIYH